MGHDEKPKSFFQTSVSQKLVHLIEKDAGELTNNWLRDIKQNSSLPTYKSYDEKELHQRAFRVYSQLGRWISHETAKDEIRLYWTALGRQRRDEGFALSEIIHSLAMIRKHLWQKVQSEGLLDTALDLYQAIELYNRVMLFFDRAIYYAALGYETER
jgi:hypothetical protein